MDACLADTDRFADVLVTHGIRAQRLHQFLRYIQNSLSRFHTYLLDGNKIEIVTTALPHERTDRSPSPAPKRTTGTPGPPPIGNVPPGTGIRQQILQTPISTANDVLFCAWDTYAL